MTKKNKKFSRAGILAITASLFLMIVFLRVLFSDETAASGMIMINPGCQDNAAFDATWRGVLDASDIYDWGRGRGLYLVDDRPPMVDKKAAVFDERGSTVTIRGLDTSKKYQVWFDFVSFVGNSNGDFFSPLTVTVKNLRTGKFYPKTFIITDIDTFSLFAMKLPYEITSGGDITIEFRETAPRYGGWGLWDMFIGAGQELPQSIKCPPAQGKPMKVKEKPLE